LNFNMEALRYNNCYNVSYRAVFVERYLFKAFLSVMPRLGLGIHEFCRQDRD